MGKYSRGGLKGLIRNSDPMYRIFFCFCFVYPLVPFWIRKFSFCEFKRNYSFVWLA